MRHGRGTQADQSRLANVMQGTKSHVNFTSSFVNPESKFNQLNLRQNFFPQQDEILYVIAYLLLEVPNFDLANLSSSVQTKQ